ncbi:MAG: AraC family transcriptional regulator [Pedosphaera sp.]|nr:AraC family transcriptional regulator [Pedosphaera sp.]
MDGKARRQFIEHLSRSRIYQDYERAFGEATGLPLALRPVEFWQPAQRKKKHENPFCALMAGHSRSCAACLEVQGKLSQDDGQASKTSTCFAGMCDSTVPIRLGSELIGFLQTGQVRIKKPSREQFQRVTRQLVEWGLKVDLNQLEEAYFHTQVLTPKQYESMVRLLTIFGQHLSLVSNQLAVQQQNAEPPTITRAKQFINEHQADDLSLGAVAEAVNTSTFYFCKMFKKATGLHFTDYLSRVRIEKAKNLLLNPNARVSEIAFEVGFQSLTHFNRVFKKVTGQSPSAYREQLPHH